MSDLSHRLFVALAQIARSSHIIHKIGSCKPSKTAEPPEFDYHEDYFHARLRLGLMSENDEFIREFLDECEENLDQLDQDLVALEKNPHDTKRLESIFRTIHTIKGTSGFFAFSKLGGLAHDGESLLGRLRAWRANL